MAVNQQVMRIGIGAAIIVVAAAGYYFYVRSPPAPPVAPAPAAAAANTAEPAAPPPIQHPVPAGAEAQSAPLPPLADSDAVVKAALGSVFGEEAVAHSFAPQNLARRIVATIDNLPRQKVAPELRPVVPMAGKFLASGPEDHPQIDPQNFTRYRLAVSTVAALDTRRLAAVYIHLYPLFQQAYEDLGYPAAYFNDRLVAVIDHLVDTPEVSGPIDLVQPRVFYEYADPTLEARSAGQKLLIRMGPENAAVIKRKLLELRAEITRKGSP